MDSLVKNTTLRFSRRFDHGFLYEPLDHQSNDKIGDDHIYRKISTSRRKGRLTTSFSYRRDRAKKRQIFLQSYKLGSDNSTTTSSSEKICKSRKLKTVANKVKSVAVSVVSFMRASSLRSCKSGLVIRAISRTRIQTCCWFNLFFFSEGGRFIQVLLRWFDWKCSRICVVSVLRQTNLAIVKCLCWCSVSFS